MHEILKLNKETKVLGFFLKKMHHFTKWYQYDISKWCPLYAKYCFVISLCIFIWSWPGRLFHTLRNETLHDYWFTQILFNSMFIRSSTSIRHSRVLDIKHFLHFNWKKFNIECLKQNFFYFSLSSINIFQNLDKRKLILMQ